MAGVQHVPYQQVFEDITILKIGEQFYNSIDWCRKYGLLAHSMNCNVCSYRELTYLWTKGFGGVYVKFFFWGGAKV